MGGGVGRVGGVVVAVVARLQIRSYLQTAFEPLAALVTCKPHQPHTCCFGPASLAMCGARERSVRLW